MGKFLYLCLNLIDMNIKPDFTPRSEEDKQKVLDLRKNQGLSFRKIEVRTGVSRETARKWCDFHLTKEENVTKKVTNVVKVKTKKPLPVCRTNIDYDFLQYIRIVYRWALANNDLSRGELDLLLYLYPIGAFTFSEFYKYHKTISLYQNKTLDKFLKEGWIKVWREKSSTQTRLFALTQKGKILCGNMHKMLVGDKEVPTDKRNNVFVDKSVKINDFYADMMKQMNKKRKKRGDN
jgi:hypothetical protein